jgi:DNA-binding NtrC family response regulator
MSRARSPSQLKILIVEDHPDSRKYLQLLLQAKGHSVPAAESISEAKALFAQEEPQVLISDIGLPDGSGCDLLQELKPSRSLYAIAMSGYGTVADLMNSSAAGFRRHIVKPFMPERLDILLEEAFLTRLFGDPINCEAHHFVRALAAKFLLQVGPMRFHRFRAEMQGLRNFTRAQAFAQ